MSLSYKPVKPVSLIQRHLAQAYALVDLAYRPVDIDAQAAAILNASAHAVQHILDHRAFLDKSGLYDMPMVAMLGETHSNVAHRISQILIVKQVAQKENVAFAFEEPHNSLVSWMRGEELRRDEELSAYKRKIELFDREMCGALSLKYKIAGNDTLSAPLSQFALQHLLLRNNIKICFCDVAKDHDGHIDQEDRSSLESVRAFTGKELPASISTLDAMGMAIRNHHMVKMVTDFAATHRPRIIFLQCGALHVTDEEPEDFYSSNGEKFEGKDYTLPALFKRTALSSVGIMQSARVNAPENDTMLVCKELPKVCAVYDPIAGEPFRAECFYHIRSARTEMSYFNALSSRTGLADEKVSLSGWKIARERCDKDVSEHRGRAWQEVFLEIG